jgi:hypothetical protein
MKKSDIFWQTYLNLEKEVIEVSKYIFVTDEITKIENGAEKVCSCKSQLETFSPHIADLLVRCCVQIEAISKELYHDIGGTKPRGSNTIFFDEDCLKEIDIKWEIHNKRVLVVAPNFNLTKEENMVLRPLKDAHKRQGTYWERCYQAVKHDRYLSMHMGNVKALLHAMAALFLLNIYYKNESWVIKFQDLRKQDFSMGSSLFAVKPPVAGQLWYGNQAQKSESPFVVTYQDADYKRIEEIQRKESEALNNYWIKQPELREPEFIAILTPLIEKQKQNPSERVMYIWELAKYRLHKRIPKTMPFEEKKRLLVNSEEWNGWIHLNNKHLTADELTPENIEAEINTIGNCWGMELEKRFQKLEWIPIAMNSGLCKIYIA